MRHATLGDTLYFWFAVNSTAGEATDATGTPTFDVRKGGAASSAIPTLEGSATLLSHANYPAGAYEIAIAATGGNGFEANAEYGVFCQATVSSVNPIGYVGGFRLAPVPANSTQIGSQTVGLSSDNRLRVDVAEWNDIPLATTNPLPNAAADAAGGLPISDAGGLDLDAQIGTKITAILADTGTDGVVVAAGSKTGYTLTATTGLGNQTADITGSLSGSVGSVTGAVGSVAGNVGGNVTGSVGSVVGAVGSVTGNVGGNVAGSVGSLATQAKADVNAEVLDVLNVDTFAQPGQENPAATTTISKMLAYLYKAWRNKSTQTSSEYALYADDGTTKDQEAACTDDGTTFTKGEVRTGA